MNKKILLIDDDSELCQELAEILKDEGYSVEFALDGPSGENLINKNVYDVILLDFKMPGLNGIEILKDVKKAKPATKVFVITGKPFIEKYLEQEKLKQLIDGFMSKPFEVGKLLEKIKTIG